MENQIDAPAAESAPGLGSALGVDVRLTIKELNLLIRTLRERKHDCLCFLLDGGISQDNPLYAQAVDAANRLDERAGNLQMVAQGANHYDPSAALDASARMIHTLATALETAGAPMMPEMDEWALMDWARKIKSKVGEIPYCQCGQPLACGRYRALFCPMCEEDATEKTPNTQCSSER